jgi:hypothetical protein
LGWISTVVVAMMYLLDVITQTNPDRSAQCRRSVFGAGDNHCCENVAIAVPRRPRGEGLKKKRSRERR